MDNPKFPDLAAALRRGEMIAFPTETVWGLGVDPCLAAAVRLLLLSKGREPDKGLPLIAGSYRSAAKLLSKKCLNSSYVKTLLQTFWPGPLTIVAEPSSWARDHFAPEVFAPDGSLALRVSPSQLPCMLADACMGKAVVATSANPSGLPVATTREQVCDYFPDLLVAGGSVLGAQFGKSGQAGTPGSGVGEQASTIIDVRGHHYIPLREGAISRQQLDVILKR